MTDTALPAPGTARRSKAAGSGSPARRRHTPRKVIGARIGTNGVLIIGSIYMVFPLVWLLFASTKSLKDLYATNALSFGDFNLFTNISNVLSQDGGVFIRWMINSLGYSILGAAIGGFVCVLCGYAFDKFEFRGKKFWFTFVLVGVMVPSTALTLPMYLLASKVGLVNTIWSIMIPFLTNPFGVYLARTFSAGYVHNATLEAARIDGATEWQTFRRVGLPMLLPGYVTVVLFQFVSIWNNFMLPLVMLSNTSLYPVSLGIYNWNSQITAFPSFYPLVLTGSLLSLIPMLLAFIGLQRFWRAGLTSGAVK